MKLFLSLFLCFIALPVFSATEATLKTDQKALLNQIYSEIDQAYAPKIATSTKTKQEQAFEQEFNQAAHEIELIIGSIKIFATKIKTPVQDFLDTSLAKYVGVIVAMKFFGTYISSLFLGLIAIVTLYRGLRITRRFAYIDKGEVKNFQGTHWRHDDFNYDSVVYAEGGIYPVIHTVTIAALTVATFAIIL
jgi:hypothetical protein